jgi:uncharacterized surface protein with fasciclin (FAS1) repeats
MKLFFLLASLAYVNGSTSDGIEHSLLRGLSSSATQEQEQEQEQGRRRSLLELNEMSCTSDSESGDGSIICQFRILPPTDPKVGTVNHACTFVPTLGRSMCLSAEIYRVNFNDLPVDHFINGGGSTINGDNIPPPSADITITTPAAPTLLNIPSTAINAGIFTTLIDALGAADLVGALSGDGPFTVFAPTDDAFAALPTGLVSCLLEEENLDALSAILTYHVLSGQVLSTDLSDGMAATTLQGGIITVDLDDDGVVKINDSEVSIADILTTNGVIHVIDAVLVPPSINVGAFLENCGDDSEDSDEAGTGTGTGTGSIDVITTPGTVFIDADVVSTI